MSDIAKCPICNGTNIRQEYEVGDCNPETYVRYECWDCGDIAPTFMTKETWNQYAAAMDYSRKTAAWFRIDPEKAGGRLADQLAEELMAEAQRKMLEVFK